MKLYVLAFLFAFLLAFLFCIFENASADWKSDVRINHMQAINDIINASIRRIQNEISQEETPAAQACYEPARVNLRDISQGGYSQVSSCIRFASIAGLAHICCQHVDSSVLNQALGVEKEASKCINTALQKKNT